MSGLLAYVQDQQQYIGLLLLSHIQLTLLSVAIGRLYRRTIGHLHFRARAFAAAGNGFC